MLTPVAVGVPLICPLEALMLKPAGRPVADHVYGVVPPLALMVALYGTPTVPSARDAAVVMLSGPATVTVAVASAIFAACAVITVEPDATPVTGIFSVEAELPSQKYVKVAGTVATAGLLEVNVTCSPVGGGGAGPDSPRSRSAVACGLTVRFCGENT